MKTFSADPNTALSFDDATNAFRSWTSAELVNNQYRWSVAESKSQQLKKAEILRRVLTEGLFHAENMKRCL
jgi:hypothetical protein